MKSFEWVKTKQFFIEVDDPTVFQDIDGVEESIAKANYHKEISSYEDDSDGAFVQVYETNDKNKPKFYIQIMGINSDIATLVARDFPALIETLRQIHPLLTLIGLDQFKSARESEQLRRKKSNNKR